MGKCHRVITMLFNCDSHDVNCAYSPRKGSRRDRVCETLSSVKCVIIDSVNNTIELKDTV